MPIFITFVITAKIFYGDQIQETIDIICRYTRRRGISLDRIVHICIYDFDFSEFYQGRKKAMTMLENMLEERRRRPNKVQRDFYDYVLEELQRKDTVLTEAVALDLMFVLLFASFETTSLAITFAIKMLAENPHVLKELTVSRDIY